MKINYAGILILGIFLTFGMEAGYAQFLLNSSRSLFSDVKAFKAGDAIMVYIMEDTQADNSASTQENRTSEISGSISGGAGSTGFKANAGMGTGNNFQGSGSTSRKERIRSRLSARVVELDSLSGNLIIEGTRTTKINGETQKIIIKGFVRPVDVMPDNSVYSYSILDLSLFIEGDGSVSKIQEPGLITKFLRLLF